MIEPTTEGDQAKLARLVEIVFEFQDLLLAHVHDQPQTVANTYSKHGAEALADEIQALAGRYDMELINAADHRDMVRARRPRQ